jgi:hypothetical protein
MIRRFFEADAMSNHYVSANGRSQAVPRRLADFDGSWSE